MARKKNGEGDRQENEAIWDRFDPIVSRIVIFSQAASIEAKVGTIYPESFAIGILTTGAHDVSSILVDLDINLEKCLRVFKKELAGKQSTANSQSTVNYANLKISKRVMDICRAANKISLTMKSSSIGASHLFIALLSEAPEICKVFEDNRLDVEQFGKIVRKMRRAETVRQSRGKKTENRKAKALDAFCTNVTEQAAQNKLDPIIAREKEIEAAITILCRRSKNNPILLGEPGVGKTAIVEGISQRIVSGTVPKQLMGFKVYSLSLPSIVAGTKYRGEFEERMQTLVKEVMAAEDCIIFIDEIHTMVGAGAASGGALDASNILKPYLARGELRCIGATTTSDYKMYFQKDSALERRFQEVTVEEPTDDQVAQILSGIKQRFEEYHGCFISEDALEATIILCKRYLPSKNFPDKAIDCIDTACAKYAWEQGSEPKDSVPVVNAKDISVVVSEQCKVPLEVILWDDYERIQKVEAILKNRIFGQDHVIDKVCRVLKNSYSGIRDPDRPIAVMVFGGTTGTGKTYLTEELASAVFGKESSYIKLDMSEYSEAHSVSKLVGSPPGYVGFQETDVFLDRVKRKPYCIIVLDEIGKADPAVAKLFLQVMSHGMMTDAIGNKVDFRNSFLVFTGNFNAHAKSGGSLGFGDDDKSAIEKEQDKLIKFCQERYGDEFVNRVDEFIYFMPLDEKAIRNIVKERLREVAERISSREHRLKFSNKVINRIVELSSKEHGKNANPIKRLISKEIEPCISDALLSLDEGVFTISIYVNKDGNFAYRKIKRKVKEVDYIES